ncbi:hypothetical protein PX554_13830 [Sphingomonas sp. H39-1-10]|uniref:hypothetical protein n=1 Tax=Sphingomonas pollutisoli TaxID=3030829 RepID=UPI0023B92F8F|nr:hypothetical protein [Sphingomonas pollutisoli]MDF0489216.1 hypothetical protein [Sphingomonas pollutisoli]
MSTPDDQLSQISAQLQAFLATLDNATNWQILFLAGSANDPDSFDKDGGKTGALGYYPIVNVSGQTVFMPCLKRFMEIALGGANAETLAEVLGTANSTLAVVYTAIDNATSAAASADAKAATAQEQADLAQAAATLVNAAVDAATAARSLSGAGAPAADLGAIGNTYIDTQSRILYGPKTADGWGSGSPLKGDPGANVMAIGPWVTFTGLLIPIGTDYVRTSGHTFPGVGAGFYKLSSKQDAAETPWRKRSANGRLFELVCDVGGAQPQQFGSLGDYNPEKPESGTDDTQGVLDCINFCMSRGNFTAYPMRLTAFYVVTVNNFLGQWTTNAATIRGWRIASEAGFAYGFVFRPTAVGGITDFYVHDGYSGAGQASQARKLLFWEISDVRFIMDARNLTTERIHGLRQSGWGSDGNPQQAWTNRNVWYSYSGATLANNGDVFTVIGTSNGSENSFYSCRAQNQRKVLACSNAQAVNHTFTDCHWELGTGNVYDFVRGGALTHVGGSIIIDNFNNVTMWSPGLPVTAGKAVHYDGVRYTADADGTLGGAGNASFTGAIVGFVLTVSDITSGAIVLGQELVGNGIPAGTGAKPPTRVVAFITGTGGTGTYLVSETANAASTGITGYTPPTHTAGSVGGLTFVADESAYLLSIGGDGTGQINDFLIEGVRIEFRTNRAKVLKAIGANIGSRVKLLGVNTASVVGGYRTTFALGDNAIKVDISGGGWNRIGTYDEPLTVSFSAAAVAPVLSTGAPILSIGGGATVSKDIHDLVKWGANSAGIVKIDDTVAANVLFGLTTNSDKYDAPDMMIAATLLNPAGSGTGAKGGTPPRRRITVRFNFYSFPSSGGTANPTGKRSRLKVVPGAVIEGIHAGKSAGGGNGQPVTFQLQNDDTGAVIATLPAFPSMSAGFDDQVTGLKYAVPRNTRMLKVADVGTGGDAGLVPPLTDQRFLDVTMTVP